MWQMVFANVPVDGWTINPYVDWFFYYSSGVLVLPNYTETVNSCEITSYVAMLINGGVVLKMFLEPFSQFSCSCTNVLFITLNSGKHVSINHPTLLCDGIFALGRKQEIFDSYMHFLDTLVIRETDRTIATTVTEGPLIQINIYIKRATTKWLQNIV